MSSLQNENIICFAGEDWWYHNPHSNLHLMQSFSKDNRVLFVNSIGVRAPNLKTDKYAWKRILGKAKSLLRYFRKAQNNIWVLTPIAVPLFAGHQRTIQRINKVLLVVQLKLVIWFMRFHNPILWVCVPSVKDVALSLRKKAKILVYYCVDNISHYMGIKNDYIYEIEQELHAKADLALFVNHRLISERASVNPNTHYLGHGVDYVHFAKAQDEATCALPQDMLGIKKPIVGYIGALTGLDFDLVKNLAVNNRDISIVFIGEVYSDLHGLDLEPNVFFLGKKAYGDLPAYMAHMSCLMIVYKCGNVFNEYRNPKKLLEYLATGKPVLSIGISEVERFREHVIIPEPEKFAEALRACLINDDAERRSARIVFAENNTWDNVASLAAEHIAATLAAI